MNTPVLLIAHARARETRRVVEAVVSAGPELVYVVTEGAVVLEGHRGDAETIAPLLLKELEQQAD